MKNVRHRQWKFGKHGMAIFLVLAMVVSMFSVIGFTGNTQAHILEGEGHPLQLYSYFYNNNLPDGNIDGDILSDASFWARAYAREMTFVQDEDGVTEIPVSMFFVNNNEYLYVAVSWDAGNAGTGNGVWLFFDEGDNTGASADGTHLDGLTNPSGERNEDGLFADKGGINNDLNWNNGASAWQIDNDASNKVMGVNSFGAPATYFNAEFKIPLSSGNDDTDDSNLDIMSTDELGIYVIIYLTGGGPPPAGHYYWDSTTVTAGNKNSGGDYEPLAADNIINQWGDLRLGLQREETKLFSTVNINGAPAIDGDIGNDIAWINSYKREMKFTNFRSGTMDVKFYSIQDQGTKDIWCGFRVEDDDFNGNDEFLIYQERESAVSPGNDRDFDLDTDYENMMFVDVGGTWDDWGYDTGAWVDDVTDMQGNAAVQFFTSPTPRYEFEFEIPYDAGTEDLNMNDNGLFGFFMKFIDTDMPAGEQEFFWEVTANSELIQIDENDVTHVSVGWVDLQMGGPAVSPVQPDDGGIVTGIDFNFRVYAEDEGGINEINFVAFKTESMDTFKNLFQEPGTGFWSSFWDTTSEPNGPTRVTIVAQDNEGITVYIYITVVISNAGAAGNPPSNVAVTGPGAPGPLSGPIVFDASALDASYVEFFIDGELFETDDTDPYQASLDTTLFDDGGHTISIRAVNIAGETTDAEMYTFENFQPASPTIASVVDGQYLEGDFTFQVYSEGPDIDHVDLTITNEDTMVDVVITAIGYNSASGYYEYTLDTMAVADGNYSVSAVAWDAAGNSASSATVMFMVDNNAPTLDVTSPADHSYVSGSVNFVYTAMDSFLEPVMYKVDNNNWMSIGAWDTTMYNDGEHTVTIKAMDTAGHMTMVTLMYIVDNNAPMAAIVNPQTAQYVEGTYTFKIVAGDMVDLDEVRLTIADLTTTFVNDVQIGYNSATGYYEFIIDTNVLVDGDYTVSVTAYDTSGLDSGVQSVEFMVDNNAPELTIVSPMNNDFVSDSVAINASAVDAFLDDITYNVDGSGWVDISVLFDTTGYEDGFHTIQIRARDMAGHETVGQVNVRVDNNAPSIGISSPAAMQYLEGTFTFKIVTMDEVGLEEVRISVTNEDTSLVEINDVPIVYNSATGYYEYTLDTLTLEDGNYSVTSTAYDLSGRSTSSTTVDFQIDNNLPMLTITNPENGKIQTGSINIEATADDVFLTYIKYNVDGAGWVDIDTQWDTSALIDGTHTLEIRAADAAGHAQTQVLEIPTDNKVPELYLVFGPDPSVKKQDQIYVGGSFFIQISAMDTMGISAVSYRFGLEEENMMFVNQDTGFYEAEIITDADGHDLTDEVHTMTITATDMADLSTELELSIRVDNSGPSITPTKPTAGSTVEGDVVFTITIIDSSGVDSVFIRLDKGEWREMSPKTTDSYTYTWNSRKAANGDYDVDIRAEDVFGNEEESTYTVTVDNFPLLAFVVFILGLVLFLTLMMVSLVKGGKPSKPKKTEDVSSSYEEETVTPVEEPAEEEVTEVEVHECPDCGAEVGASDTKCASCGTEMEADTGESSTMEGLELPPGEE